MVSTVRSARSSVATRSPKVVFPAPGVATARKSLGRAMRYFRSAVRCQARSGTAPAGGGSGSAVCSSGPGTAPGSLTRLQRFVDAFAFRAHRRSRLGRTRGREDLTGQGEYVGARDRALGDLLLVHLVEELGGVGLRVLGRGDLGTLECLCPGGAHPLMMPHPPAAAATPEYLGRHGARLPTTSIRGPG